MVTLYRSVWAFICEWKAVVVISSVPSPAHVELRSFLANCGPLSVSCQLEMPYGTVQSSSKKRATTVTAFFSV